jgi:hypothetical protein
MEYQMQLFSRRCKVDACDDRECLIPYFIIWHVKLISATALELSLFGFY